MKLIRDIYAAVQANNSTLPDVTFTYNSEEREFRGQVAIPVQFTSLFSEIYISITVPDSTSWDRYANVLWCYVNHSNEFSWATIAEVEIDSAGNVTIV